MDVSFEGNDIFLHQLHINVFLLLDDFETKSTEKKTIIYIYIKFLIHTLTCVSVRFNEAENSARSVIVKYCLSRNFFSNANN